MSRELLEQLTTTTVSVITPNLRLCHHLRLEYANLQHKKQLSSWPSLPIYPLSTWLEQLWEQLMEQQLCCLTAQQELQLWQNCLQQVSSKQHAQELLAHAQLAQSAWNRLQAWQLDYTSLDSSQHAAFQYFSQAAQLFQQQCQQHQWLTQAEKLNVLSKLLQRASAPLCSQVTSNTIQLTPIILLNFDEETPQTSYFWQQYQTHATVTHQQWQQTIEQCQLQAYAQPEAELKAMADWALEYSQQNPQHNVACVVPNIKQQRHLVEQVFTDCFYHSAQQPKLGDQTSSVANQQQLQASAQFNLSLGLALSDYPIIQIALRAIMLNDHDLDPQQICCLWQSPYLHHHACNQQIAALARLHLYQQSMLGLNLSQLQQLLHTLTKQHTLHTQELHAEHQHAQQAWIEGWQAHLSELAQHPVTASRQSWCRWLEQQLAALGWPGYQTLNSEQYQALQAFYKALTDYAGADFVDPSIPRQTFFDDIQHLCQQQLFQAQSKSPAAVQILGSIEAAGSLYDAIWISDLHAEQWPAEAAPHPFIPSALQRELGMPHASAERELAVSQRLLKRLAHSARHVLMSYAKHNDDRPQSPSTLLEMWFDAAAIKAANSNHHPAPLLHPLAGKIGTVAMDVFSDESAPAFDHVTQLKGGSALLKAQNQCAFQGFARWRLNIKAMPDYFFGLSPLQKGSLLHRALQLFWQQTKTSTALKALSQATLRQRIQCCIEQSCDDVIGNDQSSLTRLLKLESLRLQRLLLQWMEIEKKRDDFEVINCEQMQLIRVQGVQLKLQLDRMDRDLDGQHLIIDYKSGQVNWQHWFGQRSQDPQLPLYAIHASYPIAAISYASLKSGKLRYEGICDEAYEITSMKNILQRQTAVKQVLPSTWQQCLENWRLQINLAMKQFLHGDARINPISSDICQYCHLQSLCRINHHAS